MKYPNHCCMWAADSVDQLSPDNNALINHTILFLKNDSKEPLCKTALCVFFNACFLGSFFVFGSSEVICHGVCGVVVFLNVTVRANVLSIWIYRCLNIFLYWDVLAPSQPLIESSSPSLIKGLEPL